MRTFHLEGRMWRAGPCLTRGEWAGDREASMLLSWSTAHRFQPAGIRPMPEGIGPRLKALLRATTVHPCEVIPARGPAWEVGFDPRGEMFSFVTYHHGRATLAMAAVFPALEEIAELEDSPFGGLLLLDRIIRAGSDGVLTLPMISAALMWRRFEAELCDGWERLLMEQAERRAQQLALVPRVERALEGSTIEGILPGMGPVQRAVLPPLTLRSDAGADVEISTGRLRLPGFTAWELTAPPLPEPPPSALTAMAQLAHDQATTRRQRPWWMFWRR